MLWSATSELLDVPLKLIIGSGSGTARLYAAFDSDLINLIPRSAAFSGTPYPPNGPGTLRTARSSRFACACRGGPKCQVTPRVTFPPML